MDDFYMFCSSFDACSQSNKVLQKYREKNLTPNQEKYHFMLKKDIVLGHVVSHDGIEVDKAKYGLIANLSPPTCMKDIRSFSRQCRIVWVIHPIF